MQDILTIVANIQRPSLLIRAARIGTENYRPSSHLARVLGYAALHANGQVIVQLLDIESYVNEQRVNGDAAYSVIRHVDIMIAIMGEAQLFRASRI